MAAALARRLVSLVTGVGIVTPSSGWSQANPAAAAPLPTPTGPLAVGTTVAYLIDSQRPDQGFPRGRPITLQLWYPAARTSGAPAGYLVEPGLAAALRRYQYYGVDSTAVDRWSTLATHSLIDAEPLGGSHPLLAFSVGLGVIRANYTSIAEELASHGYIIALVESPLQGLLMHPDGHAILDSTGAFGETAAHRRGVATWAGDIGFALDQLAKDSTSPMMAKLRLVADGSRIGGLGHSSGGLVAVASCESDSRIRACVNMDGGVTDPDRHPLADFVTRGVTKPTLFLRSQPLYDDTTLARRGMTREQWITRGEAGRLGYEALAARSRGPLWAGHVAGTGHFSFSDAPFVMPTAISRFGGRIIAADRGWRVITAALRAFFDRELRRQGEGLAGLTARMPELTVIPPKGS